MIDRRKKLLKDILDLLNKYEEDSGAYVGLEIGFLDKDVGATPSIYQIVGDVLPINSQAKSEYY